MSLEPPQTTSVLRAEIQQAAKELPPVEIQQPAPTPEEAQLAATVFAQQQEQSAAAALVGLWSGAVVLRDVLADHLTPPADLDEKKKKPAP